MKDEKRIIKEKAEGVGFLILCKSPLEKGEEKG
jgi:hypothetical protein